MPHTISLKCFSEDFSTSTNINYNRLLEVISTDTDLKIAEDDSVQTLFTWNEKREEWLPLLWLTEEKSYINSNPVFEFDLYYDLARISEKLDATIITEEGRILFTPGYGLLLDPEEGIAENVEIGELTEELKKTGDLSTAISNIQSKPGSAPPEVIPTKTGKSNKINDFLTSKTGNIIAIILTVIFCLIILLKAKK
jgi:hypothetical protein